MIKEFCAENYTSIPLAIARGANRIELCDNLAVGGTTPSTGVIEETLSYAGEKNIPVMTIIRPRGGDFVYNDIELKIMHTDLIEAKKRCDAVCVTEDATGQETSLEKIVRFRRTLGDFPLFVCAGVTPENAAKQLAYADGAVVGSYFKDTHKDTGDVYGPHVRDLMRVVEDFRKTL